MPGSVTRAHTPTRQRHHGDGGPHPAPGHAGVDQQRGAGGAGQRAGVEQGVQAHQRRGLAHQAVGRLRVHGGVDGAPGHLDEDEHHGEGPGVAGERAARTGAPTRRAARSTGGGARPTRSQKCAMTALDAPPPRWRRPGAGRAGRRRGRRCAGCRTASRPSCPRRGRRSRTTPRPDRPRRAGARPTVAGGVALRTGPRRPPWPGRWPGPPRTRVTRPAPTRPPPSSSRRAADTVKVSRRPSTLTSVASASTTEPTATGARWSNCTRVATLDCASLRCPSVARHVASSHRAMRRGVASTGTSPERKCSAVSSAATVSSSWALSPACGPCPRGRGEGSAGTTITIPP